METSNSFPTLKYDYNVVNVMSDFLDCISPFFNNVIMLKGCMALKINVKFKNDLRGTRDLDMNFASKEDWEIFCSTCCDLANKYTKLNIVYSTVKRRGYEKILTVIL